MHEGHDGGATTHALCGVLVLDSESLGFARRYSLRSFDVLYLSSWVAQLQERLSVVQPFVWYKVSMLRDSVSQAENEII
ncbi:hypothetical protein M405DRAFT_834620 [Rhizopogon salebrosus TDB-379]|nr:hypothetical protein M405DRAFT_834620 [Rhizopogon salebrosus TDB-379]